MPTAIKNFIKANGKGLKKVMSKMGISTYMVYTGAQISRRWAWRGLVDKYFAGTTSSVEGIDVFELAEESIRRHRAAFGEDPVLAKALDAGGEYAFRVRGEEHMWTPDAIAKLQHSTRATIPDIQGICADHQRSVPAPHDFPRPVRDQVRPREVDTDRGSRTGLGNREALRDGRDVAGSISIEAHMTLAVAMNRIGGKSNTGEGGEDRKRYALVKGETLLRASAGTASKIDFR